MLRSHEEDSAPSSSSHTPTVLPTEESTDLLSSETGLLQPAINCSAYQRLFPERDLTLTKQALVINVTFDQYLSQMHWN